MTITIELIAEHYIGGFRACLDAVAKEERFLGMTRAPPLEQVETFVRENIRVHNPQYVALLGGVVVSWCDALPNPPDALKHRATLGMGVLSEHRGKRIGERLVTSTVAHASRNGVKRIDLEVRADNLPAIGLYTKLGFRTEGHKVLGLCFGGIFYDTLQMGLLLDSPAAQPVV